MRKLKTAPAVKNNLTTDGDVRFAVDGKYFKKWQDVIEQFKNGRTNVIGFLVGQVIKKSKGQANPGLVSKVLNEKIKEY